MDAYGFMDLASNWWSSNRVRGGTNYILAKKLLREILKSRAGTFIDRKKPRREILNILGDWKTKTYSLTDEELRQKKFPTGGVAKTGRGGIYLRQR